MLIESHQTGFPRSSAMYNFLLVALSCALVLAPGLVVVLRRGSRYDDDTIVEY